VINWGVADVGVLASLGGGGGGQRLSADSGECEVESGAVSQLGWVVRQVVV